MHAVKQLRAEPQLLTIEVPSTNGAAPLIIDVVRPAHPCDHLTVALDAAVLEHLFRFIRDRGISQEQLLTKRAYKGVGEDVPAGISCDKKGVVVKVQLSSGNRLMRAKTLEEAIAKRQKHLMLLHMVRLMLKASTFRVKAPVLGALMR